ncbi:BMP family lipoprotein [Roseospira navarrensis]|nr:BMP family ABC transporter substrate-binding protein [Roseospira navarrensis]
MVKDWAWLRPCHGFTWHFEPMRSQRPGLRIRTLLIVLLGVIMSLRDTPPVLASESLRPALLFHTDVALGEQGAGYFELAAVGAQAFAASADTPVPMIFPRDVAGDARDSDGALATTRFALEQGYTAVVGAGFNYAGPFAALAPEYPDVRFVLIDAVVDAPNVESVLFREEQGSYLVGILAALFSDAGHIGFVGGWDAPIIRKFGCGFIQGALSVRPDITVDVAMIGHTPQAFYQADEGERLAGAMFDAGADVVYHAAGQSGDGVIRAALDHDAYAIGVDINQNGGAPGHVLTSMLKRVDIAVFSSLQRMARGTWSAGLTVLGLSEGGVDWALDRHNVQLVSERMHTAVENAEFDIRTGVINVAVHTEEDGCPVHDFDTDGDAADSEPRP